MKLKDILNEKITIDVEIGDTILTGRFKNKKTKVNSIETDQHGMPTINGRKVTTFRTMKKQDESTAAYKKSLEKIARDKQLKMLSKKDKETLMKIAKMMKEGPQRDRNNLALYIIDLNNTLSNAKILAKKDPKYKKYIKFIEKDIKDAKEKLAKMKESVDEKIDFKKAHKKFKETGELPPHLQKLAKDLDKVKVKHKVKNIVVPGLEWMADIDEGTCGYSIDGEGDDEPAGPHLIKKIKKEDFDASYKIIKMMMDGVKGGKYDALDIIRGIETGALNRTHEGERPFMKMLWRKVRKEFRRYSKKGKLRKENEIGEAKERDYKDEYKKFQSSTKAKKYRAELNKYNRKKGTYGNGDGKDASHKGGKIVGFEAQSKNRGRREKSRLKKK